MCIMDSTRVPCTRGLCFGLVMALMMFLMGVSTFCAYPEKCSRSRMDFFPTWCVRLKYGFARNMDWNQSTYANMSGSALHSSSTCCVCPRSMALVT